MSISYSNRAIKVRGQYLTRLMIPLGITLILITSIFTYAVYSSSSYPPLVPSSITEQKEDDSKKSIKESSSGKQQSSEKSKQSITGDIGNKLNKVSLPFIENIGQIENKDVKFYTNTFAGTVFVAKDGSLTYSFVSATSKEGADHDNVSTQSAAVNERFLANKQSLIPSGFSKSNAVVNYFVGDDKQKWHSGIPTYDGISLGEVWPYINLELHAYDKNVEKIFKVLPGGDVEDIRITFEGVKSLSINEAGELVLETDLGNVKMTKPSAFQDISGKHNPVDVSYVVNGKDTYSFVVTGHYDPTHTLVIDPLLASTVIGGGSADGTCCTIGGGDSDIALQGNSGNVLVAGTTQSTDFPATKQDAFDKEFSMQSELFLSWLSNDLSSLWVTTFIGIGAERASDIVIDESGNVFVAGQTGSPTSRNFPTTTGPFGPGGGADVFVAKLSNDLSSLKASTRIGGTAEDGGGDLAIALDPSGNVFVHGTTRSNTDFPMTLERLGGIPLSGDDSAFVSKLSSDNLSLLASRLIGGGSHDHTRDIALDGSGNVFVTGLTQSLEAGVPFPFPTTIEPYGSGGGFDAYVTKLTNDLSELQASRLIGGFGDEVGADIEIDGSGDVLVAGQTAIRPNNFPITVGPHGPAGGSDDTFVTKLTNNLAEIRSSTRIGGLMSDSHDVNTAMTLDRSGNIFLAGRTGSNNFPTTAGAFDRVYNGGSHDVFISKLSNDLSSLVASTFIGGRDRDSASHLAVDESGNVFVTGYTLSGNSFPMTTGGHGLRGDADVFVSKLDGDL
jgi:hypothetical protein